MVNHVGFMISEEDLASGPDARLDRSGLLCGRSFITVKRDRETSELDIRRGQRVPHSASLEQETYILFKLAITTNQKHVSRL